MLRGWGFPFWCFCTSVVVNSVTFEDTIYVNKGEQFTVPCKNDTPGMYIGIVWKEKTTEIYRNLRSYGLDIHEKINRRSRLVNQTSLQIDNASVNDEGVYQCILVYIPKETSFPHAIAPSLIKVVVFVQPNITSVSPAVQYLSLGQEAIIKCKFEGIPSAKVLWKFDGSNGLMKIRYKTEKNVSVLQVKRLSKRDSGYYTCIVYNRAGKVEKMAYVKVMYPPVVVYLSPNPHIDMGSTGQIICKARGYPLPEIFWGLRDDKTAIELSAGEKGYRGRFSVSTTQQNHAKEWSKSVLTIRSLQVEDWKINFTCMAANNQASYERGVRVRGFRIPDPPKVIRITTTSTTATLVWTPPFDGGSKIFAYILQYKNLTDTIWKSKEIRPANVHCVEISGLLPDTHYEFRMSARNDIGMSVFSGKTTSRSQKEKDPDNQGGISDATVTPNKQGSQGSSNNDENFGGLGISGVCGVAGGLILFIIFLSVSFYVMRRQKSPSSQTTSMLGSRPVSLENGSLAPPESRRPSEMPSEHTEFIPLLTRADHWEFPRDRLRLSTMLGSGAFGMVMRGDAQGIRGSTGIVKVAVKIPKENDTEYARKDLYAELDVLKLLPAHPNVIGLLGCCTRIEPIMIIVEYCAYGDLQGFLRNSRGISESYYRSTYHPTGKRMASKMLLKFALQIAKGMSHLAAYKIIHRDLAARNILVDGDFVCKISDFGFARDVYIEDQYLKKTKGGRFPIKWMALESLLDGISTPMSDVWAFGVVLWEIITLGASPYPGMSSYEVVSFLQDGHRMDKPKHCSDELYTVSLNCWHLAPQRRPTFNELSNILQQMLEDDQEFINMNFYQDHLYENFDVNLACQSSANDGTIDFNPNEALDEAPNEATPLAVAALSTAEGHC